MCQCVCTSWRMMMSRLLRAHGLQAHMITGTYLARQVSLERRDGEMSDLEFEAVRPLGQEQFERVLCASRPLVATSAYRHFKDCHKYDQALLSEWFVVKDGNMLRNKKPLRWFEAAYNEKRTSFNASTMGMEAGVHGNEAPAARQDLPVERHEGGTGSATSKSRGDADDDDDVEPTESDSTSDNQSRKGHNVQTDHQTPKKDKNEKTKKKKKDKKDKREKDKVKKRDKTYKKDKRARDVEAEVEGAQREPRHTTQENIDALFIN